LIFSIFVFVFLDLFGIFVCLVFFVFFNIFWFYFLVFFWELLVLLVIVGLNCWGRSPTNPLTVVVGKDQSMAQPNCVQVCVEMGLNTLTAKRNREQTII